MGKLIDADVLIEELKMQCADCMECKERSIGGIVKGAINDCIKIVDRQPTAYDVDAVVEELKNAGNQEVIFHGGRCNGKTIAVGFCKGIERAIDIVRKGGKE